MTHQPVDLLILGAGWTAEYLISYIENHRPSLSYRTTNTTGAGKFDSIKFNFDPTRPDQSSNDLNQFNSLPNSYSILISFPIKDPGASQFLLDSYARSRKSTCPDFKPEYLNIIQLGSSGIFDGGPTLDSTGWDGPGKFQAGSTWIDRHSPYDLKNARAQSEDEMLKLNNDTPACWSETKFRTTVLNLCGLWGGNRSIRKYVSKVAPTKEGLRSKSSIHMIHGLDVARAIVAVLDRFSLAAGQRWILTDQRVYDWWDLASAWGQSSVENRDTEVTIGPQAQWVNELMLESNTRALPRPPIELGRALDSREFWTTFGLSPVRARMEHDR